MVVEEKLKIYLDRIETNNNKINALIYVRPSSDLISEARNIDKKIKEGKSGRLAGKIIVIKPNINILGLNISCASKVLDNYISPYDATVIKKIKEEDGLIIGLANMDEFACGSSGETSAFGPTKNPKNLDLVSGGSSSGSAASVAAGFCDIALGSDTGGSIRNPSSICGVFGLKPSYGAVSRYGLIDLSMSLDQIGPIANNIEDIALMFDVIKGKDELDPKSIDTKPIKINSSSKLKKINIGILNLASLEVDKSIDNLVHEKIKSVCKTNGWSSQNVNINHLDLAVETYYPLVYTEFFSGTRRFDGRRYGRVIEDFSGPEVLRRILGGFEITKAEHYGRYYDLALKVKGLIEKEFSNLFKNFDCIICPTLPRLPWKIGEKISVEDGYKMDVLTIPPNLAGNCAISVPIGEIDNCPVGIQIICDSFEENKLLRIAKSFSI